ncbi:MAG: RNA polymerase sigma factor [Draconibacterium sp.]
MGRDYKRREVVEVLFKKHYSELCQSVYVILKNDDDAEDVVQQFFVDFILNKRYKKVETSMEGYLFQSVRYAALKLLKQKIKNQHLQIDDFKNIIQDHNANTKHSGVAKELNSALNSLPPKCKEVLVMVHMQNLTYLETSKVLGVSINTVKTQLKRGMSLLREKVSYPLYPEFE